LNLSHPKQKKKSNPDPKQSQINQNPPNQKKTTEKEHKHT
jgi:hypothetical protein